MTRKPLTRGVLFGLLAIILIMIAGVAWAVLQMAVFDPGHAVEDYMAGMERFYLIVGVPVLILTSWLAARRTPGQAFVTALIVAVTCIALELIVQAATASFATESAPLLVTSAVTKIVAALIGGWLAKRAAPLATDGDATI